MAAFLFPGFALYAIRCLTKCFAPRDLVSWSLEKSNMFYGYGCAFCINHCSFSWLKTSAPSACFVQSRSQPVSSPSSWHHRGETGACQRSSDTSERTRGHKNHKDPDFDIVEQQFAAAHSRPLRKTTSAVLKHHPKQSIMGNMTAYGLCQCFSLIVPPSSVVSYQRCITLRCAYCLSPHTHRKTWRSPGGSNQSKSCCYGMRFFLWDSNLI